MGNNTGFWLFLSNNFIELGIKAEVLFTFGWEKVPLNTEKLTSE